MGKVLALPHLPGMDVSTLESESLDSRVSADMSGPYPPIFTLLSEMIIFCEILSSSTITCKSGFIQNKM